MTRTVPSPEQSGELVKRLRLLASGHRFDAVPVVTEAADTLESAQAEIARLTAALRPFADCVDQIDPEEDEEEWAKFRLLIKDYRRASLALTGKRHGFERCPTCGGEFDEGEWGASNECPECETPISRAALEGNQP